jgi:Zn-dependent membrane protease YugP
MFFLDSGYWIFVLPALIFAMYAQSKVSSAYNTYSRYASRSGMTGAQMARELLNASGLSNVKVEAIKGRLTDQYDSQQKVLRLSDDVYGSNSIAAIGIAAHEVGHAIQDGSGYAPLALRNGLVPVAQLGSSLAFPLFFIGFIFRSGWIMDVGLIVFAAAVVFTLITLPVEFNASSRAVAVLEANGYVQGEEVTYVKAVLDAAALTYVAAAAVAIGQFLRLLSMRNRER